MVPEMDSGPVRSPAQCSLVGGQARHGAVMMLGTWTVMKETITGARLGGPRKGFPEQKWAGRGSGGVAEGWWPKKEVQDSISGEGPG